MYGAGYPVLGNAGAAAAFGSVHVGQVDKGAAGGGMPVAGAPGEPKIGAGAPVLGIDGNDGGIDAAFGKAGIVDVEYGSNAGWLSSAEPGSVGATVPRFVAAGLLGGRLTRGDWPDTSAVASKPARQQTAPIAFLPCTTIDSSSVGKGADKMSF